MKKLKDLALKVSSFSCVMALLLALNSINITCSGKYYQPKAPAALREFKSR